MPRISHADSKVGGPVTVSRADNGDVLRLEGFLARNGHPHTNLDPGMVPGMDPGAKALIERFHIDPGHLPVVLCPDGRLLRNPGEQELARCIDRVGPLDPGCDGRSGEPTGRRGRHLASGPLAARQVGRDRAAGHSSSVSVHRGRAEYRLAIWVWRDLGHQWVHGNRRFRRRARTVGNQPPGCIRHRRRAVEVGEAGRRVGRRGRAGGCRHAWVLGVTGGSPALRTIGIRAWPRKILPLPLRKP